MSTYAITFSKEIAMLALVEVAVLGMDGISVLDGLEFDFLVLFLTIAPLFIPSTFAEPEMWV